MEVAVEDRPVSVNAPLVVSETIDGEAIVMHHGSGLYFDIVGSGALLWEAIERTTTRAALAATLVAAYRLAPAQADSVVRDWLATLAEHDLIAYGVAPAAAAAAVPVAVAAEPFAAPVLGVHADLADMLLLDPIHDVDEAGWPMGRAHG